MRRALVLLLLASRWAQADPADDRWSVHGQLTWIEQAKLPFHAAYTNVGGSTNSLVPGYENSFTGTASLFTSVKLWDGAQAFFVPEAVSELPLSNLHGLGGAIQNFELQKGGNPTPLVYVARAYLQQTFELGRESRRIALSAGRFSVLDFMDHNQYAGDLRRQFFDMAFMTYAAYDFVADTRGYTWGAVAEVYVDDWALRVMRAAPPQVPNGADIEFRFWKYYGDQLELEHDHVVAGLPGAVRVLGYRNHENMGRFDDALTAFGADPAMNAAGCGAAGLFHYGSTNPNAPDLCWVRKPNDKVGIGINVEQAITRDIGVFLRAMYSDGDTEVYAFTPTDRSLSIGALARGGSWGRPADYAGIGFGAAGISERHAAYLAAGGIDGFVGDGRLRAGTETVSEAFYGANLWHQIWLSGDYLFIVHPAFNVDRGPVHVFGARLHAEF
jgi:hypothetical protein